MTMTWGTADQVSFAGATGASRGRRRLAATVSCGLLGVVFIFAGVVKLIGTEFEIRAFEHFGYALWFMYVIGAVELAGGVMLLMPGLSALGAIAMMPIMVGAVFSHLFARDPILMAAPAVVLLTLLAWTAYARRWEIFGD